MNENDCKQKILEYIIFIDVSDDVPKEWEHKIDVIEHDKQDENPAFIFLMVLKLPAPYHCTNDFHLQTQFF